MSEMTERITEKIEELEAAVRAYRDASAELKEASAKVYSTASAMSRKAAELVRDIREYHSRRSSELMAMAERIAEGECES